MLVKAFFELKAVQEAEVKGFLRKIRYFELDYLNESKKSKVTI